MDRVSRSRYKPLRPLLLLFLAALSMAPAIASAQSGDAVDKPAPAKGSVVVIDVRGGIGVATSDYITSGLQHALESSAQLVVLQLDTPGGLVSPMRDIVQAILASPVPVATYVTPAGARAASAGTYILLASHIAAMTPTTHLGAATPVSLTGGDMTPESPQNDPEDSNPTDQNEPGNDADPSADPTDVPAQPSAGSAMERKVLNDSVSYIRSLANRYGRNADWAETAVTEAATLTASEALEQNVIEFVAEDRDDLMQQLDGYEVSIGAAKVKLQTADAPIDAFEPNWRIKLLSVISNPEIVLILGMIGLYGLMYEGWNPGAVVPGVVGVICLLLAAYALQVIPVNYAGLALILVGLALMTAEAFAPSFGALGLGGVAAFVFGAIIMFDSGVPGFDISLSFVIAVAIVAAIAIIWLVSFTLKLHKRGAVSGTESIVGGHGQAMNTFTESGKVWLEGEAWTARSSVPIEKNQDVVVIAMDGLVLEVAPVTSNTNPNPEPIS